MYKLFFLLLLLQRINLSKGENFCINCKHYRSSFIGSPIFAQCAVFPIIPTNNKEDKYIDYLVSGKKKKTEYRFCSTARLEENRCGPKGKYYEKREDPFIDFLCNSKKDLK